MKLYNPFSFGTQVLDWKERNCHKCKFGYDYKNLKWQCKLEEKLDLNLFLNEEFDEDFCKQIGFNEKTKGQLTWDCPSKKELEGGGE